METEVGEKNSLSSRHGRKLSVCMVLCAVVNVGLLVYSHIGVNAYVYSTLKVDGENLPGVVDDAGRCANEVDSAIWTGEDLVVPNNTDRCQVWNSISLLGGRSCPYKNENAAQDAFIDFLIAYGLCLSVDTSRCGSLSGEDLEKTQTVLSEEWGFSTGCGECMYNVMMCVLDKCAASCAKVLLNNGCPDEGDIRCVSCIEESCLGDLEKCSGLSIPDLEQYEFRNCGLNSKNDSAGSEPVDSCFNVLDMNVKLYEIFEIRFANAVTKAWEGGAYVLSLLVAIASGAWPYAKNLIMMFVWFVPMTPAKRDRMLVWLARLGRWSLVDVFAVILIIVGVRIDKLLPTGSYLIVRSESSFAIYCFAVAAVWALAQGEYIRYLSRRQEKLDGVYLQRVEREGARVSRNIASMARLGVVCIGACCLGLLAAGALLENLNIRLLGITEDFVGPNVYAYSAVEIGTSLVDACQLNHPGEYFMLVLFFVTVFLLPVFGLFGYMSLALMPHRVMSNHRGFMRLINVFANFQCLDVFLLSMLVLVAQFEPLIDGSIGKQADEICGIEEGDTESVCLKFEGKLKTGSILLAVSVVLFWFVQYLAVLLQRFWHAEVLETDGESKVGAESSSGDQVSEWK